MTSAIWDRLAPFADTRELRSKGGLSIALIVTQHAKRFGLPVAPERLLTNKGAQVLGAGGDAVQAILTRHGIARPLASEGGRTSRGSVANMREYVGLLNEMAAAGPVDLEAVEAFWIERVRQYFDGKPFKIRLDAARGLRTVVRDVIEQAMERQKKSSGTMTAGAVLQHLVGAKLECVLGPGSVTHHGFSTADAPGGRAGDFLVGDVAIHVTTMPGEALIGKCRQNLDSGLRPMLVTLRKGVAVAEGLAANVELGERIDIFEVEQFVALNLYELGRFGADGRRVAVGELVDRYNEIVEEQETDPSLKIELRR